MSEELKILTVEDGAADAERIDHALCDGGLCFRLSGNGICIAPESLTRISMHGFGPRRSGPGFGFQRNALAAHELGGASDGEDCGATFTLTLAMIEPRPSDVL